jgi:hypothetical protein
MALVGLEITMKNLPRPLRDEHAVTAWIEARLNDARNTFVRNVSRGTGGGRVYSRGRRTHRASAPGEYPATDTGRLVNSVDYRMVSPTEGVLFSDIDYAEYLTKGTRHMAKRKMMREAVEEALASRPVPADLKGAVKLSG